MLRAIPPFLRGRKGGKYKNTPDTIRSEDSVEVILGVGEGENYGLSEGAKSFLLGGTALVNSNDEPNFKDFRLTEYTGLPNPPAVIPALGGFGSPTAANVSSLATNTAVVRTGQLTNIDYLDLRFLVQQLHRSDDKGIYTHELKIKIEYRPSLPGGQPWALAWSNVVSPPAGYTSSTPAAGVNIYEGGGVDETDVLADAVSFPQDNINLVAAATPPAAPTSSIPTIWVDTDDGRPHVYQGGGWVVAPGVSDDGTHWTYGSTHYYKNPPAPPPNPSIGDVWTPPGTTDALRFNGSAWILSLLRGVIAGGYSQPRLGAANGILSMTQKITSPTVREVRVPVPRIGVPYDIRVTKISEDTSSDGKKVSEVGWESFEEILAEGRSFPDTHILHIVGRASDQFNSLPELTGDVKGRIVEVPTNYDPVTRTYTGVWDGVFKKAWTDNGAWCTRDFIRNSRYGLSALYPYEVKEASFYAWAVWCDEAVPNNNGTSRPRWTYNDVLDQPRQAKEQANYMAGAAGGRLIDDGSGVFDVLVDKDEPMTMIFGPENVVEGEFTYSFTDIQTRANWIKVGFVNPELNWEIDFRLVKDDAHIAEYGRIPLEFVAAGKTNVSEALAAARLRLVTGTTEYTAVTFQTNRIGKYLFPFKVIGVCDPDMGWGVSGRIRSTNGLSQVLLRDPVYFEAGVNYKMVFNLPTSPISTVSLDVVPGQTGSLTAINLVAPTRTNKLLRANAIPTPAEAGQHSHSGGAATFTVVSDQEALDTAGLGHLATTGQVYKLDNSAGATAATVTFPGNNTTLVPHVASIYVRGGSGWFRHNNGATGEVFAASAEYVRRKFTYTPTIPNDGVRLVADPGQVLYLILAQFEEGTVPTAPIPNKVPGAVTVTSALDDLPEFAQFGIESYDGSMEPIATPKAFKILTITPADGDSELVEITALELNRTKWAFVDGTGELLDAAEYSSFNGPITRPANVVITPTVATTGGVTRRNLQIQWDQPSNPFARNTIIEYSRDGNTFAKIGESATEFFELENVTSGVHALRLTHIHNDGIRKSMPVTAIHEVTSNYRYIPPVINLVLADEPAPPAFESLSPLIRWEHGDVDPNFRHYRVRVRDASTNAQKRLVDVGIREFIYDFDKNKSDFGGTPARSFKLTVTKVDDYGNESAEAALTLTNAAPAAPTVAVTPATGGINVSLSVSNERDVVGAQVSVALSSGGTLIVADSAQGSFFIPLADNATRYVKGAYYDRFSKTGLNWSAEQTGARIPVTVTDLDNTPPATVTGLTTPVVSQVVAPDGTITKYMSMSWTAVAGVTGYDIEIDDGTTIWTEWSPVNSLKNYRLYSGRTYTFKVKAVTRLGVRSTNWSSTVTTGSVAGDTTAPGPISGATVTALPRRNVLGWVKPADADYSHIRLYRNTTGAAHVEGDLLHERITGSTFADTNVAAGVTYYYASKSVDTSGNTGVFNFLGVGTPGYITRGPDVLTNDPDLVTQFGVSSLVLNQGSLATQNAVTALQVPYATIANSFNDEDFTTALVSPVNGAAYDTTAETLTTLGAVKSIKSPTGNGSLTPSAVQFTTFNTSLAVGTGGGGSFRFTTKVLVKAGFTGLLRARIYFLNTAGGALGSPTIITIVDKRVTAQASTGVVELDQQVPVPTGAARAYFAYFIDWSSTQANAGYALIAKPGMRFVSDFGSLTPDAVRLGSNVRRNNGTTVVGDADAITALGTAALLAGQSRFATQSVGEYASNAAAQAAGQIGRVFYNTTTGVMETCLDTGTQPGTVKLMSSLPGGSSVTTATVFSAVGDCYLELSMSLDGGTLDTDTDWLGTVTLEEYNTTLGWRTVATAPLTVASSGLFDGSAYQSAGGGLALNGTGTRTGNVTYKVSITRTGGATFVAGATLNAALKITPIS